jgi:hypothetical protein
MKKNLIIISSIALAITMFLSVNTFNGNKLFNLKAVSVNIAEAWDTVDPSQTCPSPTPTGFSIERVEFECVGRYSGQVYARGTCLACLVGGPASSCSVSYDESCQGKIQDTCH